MRHCYAHSVAFLCVISMLHCKDVIEGCFWEDSLDSLDIGEQFIVRRFSSESHCGLHFPCALLILGVWNSIVDSEVSFIIVPVLFGRCPKTGCFDTCNGLSNSPVITTDVTSFVAVGTDITIFSRVTTRANCNSKSQGNPTMALILV